MALKRNTLKNSTPFFEQNAFKSKRLQNQIYNKPKYFFYCAPKKPNCILEPNVTETTCLTKL